MQRLRLHWIAPVAVVILACLSLSKYVGWAAAQDSVSFDHFRAWRSGDQAIASSTWTVVDWDSVDYEGPVGQYEAGNSRYRVGVLGYYLVCSRLRFAGTASIDQGENSLLRVRHYDYEGGTTQYYNLEREVGLDTGSSTGLIDLGGCVVLEAEEYDYIYIETMQQYQSSLAVDGGKHLNWFTVDFLPRYIEFPPTPTPYTPVPTDTPTATLTPTSTITPTATLPISADPYGVIVTQTLSSGNNWAFVRALTAGEIAMGAVGLCLLVVVLFKILVSVA